MQSRLIIDCDAGRDDALAIWLALNLEHRLSAVVASYGNTTLDNVVENCRRILAFAGRADIPVYRGAAGPSRQHKGFDAVVAPRQAVAGNGLCNLELPLSPAPPSSTLDGATLARLIIDTAQEHGPIEYVITGPVTNFAAALPHLGTDASRYIKRVTAWGCKLAGLWSTQPGAEFNTICDPYATHALLQSGLPVRYIPMDVTWDINLTLPETEALSPETNIARFCKDLMIAHMRNFAPEPIFRFHDPVVVAALSQDAYFRDARISINMDENDPAFGRTFEDSTGAPIKLYRPESAQYSDILNDLLSALGFAR